MMVNAKALMLHAPTKIKPKIVDDHAGSSDITQSIDANVIEMISSARPGPLTRACWAASWTSWRSGADGRGASLSLTLVAGSGSGGKA